MFKKFLSIAIVLFLFHNSGTAQVKLFHEVTGHHFGERITENYQSLRYLEHVAAESDRATFQKIGQTWDRKPQAMLIISHPDNLARIDEIQSNAQKLNDARSLSSSEARQISENQPAIFYLGGSIHGFELSGAEAILKVLENLVTRDDDEIQAILRNTVILIDPIINADGRDAFAQFNHQRNGRITNPSDNDWNNDFTRWQALQFRTSHYFFDINRDWFAHTHPETRNRVAILSKWHPQVGIDAHEMGSNVEFYFDPPTDPIAPFFPDYANKWFSEFGNAYAKAFDDSGFEYMTKERFNYFYPGYTTSFLSYMGAVGMLFEQGSTRGLSITRPDHSVRTLEDALEQQYTAAMAALKLTAERKTEIIADYFSASSQAIEDGQQGVRRYFISPQGDPHHITEVVNMLQRLGIEVGKLSENSSIRNSRDRYGSDIGSIDLPAGTYVIEAAQPRNRYIRTLFEPSTPVPDNFLAEARERLDRGENPRFYDMTSWSLPLMFNLDAYSSSDRRGVPTVLLDDYETPVFGFPSEKPSYAYVIDGNQSLGLSVLYRMRANGFRVGVLTNPTRVDGKDFHSGSIIFRIGANDDNLHSALREVAAQFKVDVTGVNTGHAEGNNPSLGSGDLLIVQEPKIAIVAEDPISPLSFGFAWHKLDRQYEIDQTIIRASSISGMDLSAYNVLILPEVFGASQLRDMLGESGKNRLNQWVRDGGTLISLGSASEFVRSDLELGSLRSFYDLEENEKAQRITTPGAFVKTNLDQNNWLTSGIDSDLPFLIFSSRHYLYPDGTPSSGQRMPVKVQEQNFEIAGHIWEESKERLGGNTLVYEERIGSGRIILFSEDTNFRGYWRGPDRLFLNAVLLGPSAN